MPDYLFEVGWEVCNKVGGIHTVISTKALTVTKRMGDNYIVIGPDLMQEHANPEFAPDHTLLAGWRESLYNEGIRVRIGRWNVEGHPIAVLIDFKSLISQKDEVLKHMWEDYHVDSISGQWDYIEPVLFGHAAGMVIKSYVDNFCTSVDRVAAHFHEWMTASGGLYLRKASPYVATLFTTHATVTGRCIAGNGLPLYSDLHKYNADDIARRFNVTAKHSIEKMAALYHDAPEIITGDMPTPVKYSSPGLRDAYKALEAESVASMTRLLPPELAEEVSPFISGSLLTAEEKRLLKAADRLSALVKCMEEQRSGNHEFDAALRQQQEALEGMHCPEADWFMAHCLPCFTQNLDELTRSE